MRVAALLLYKMTSLETQTTTTTTTEENAGLLGSGQHPTHPPTLADPLDKGKADASTNTEISPTRLPFFDTLSPNTCLELLPLLSEDQIQRELEYQRTVLNRDLCPVADVNPHDALDRFLSKKGRNNLDRLTRITAKHDELTASLSCTVREAEKLIADLTESRRTQPTCSPPASPVPQQASSSPRKQPFPVRFLPDLDCGVTVEDIMEGMDFAWEGNRKVAHYGGVSYRYGKKHHKPRPYPDNQALKSIISALADKLEDPDFSAESWCCTANFYPDGRSSIPWHSDDEPEIASDSSLVCVSIGAPRNLHFRSTSGPITEQVHELNPGSVYCMSRASQEYWQHSIPPTPSSAPRVSLTFRKLVAQAPASIPPIQRPTNPAPIPTPPKRERVLFLSDSVHLGLPPNLFPAHVQVVKRPLYQLRDLEKHEHCFSNTKYVVISSGINDLSRYGHRARSLLDETRRQLVMFSRKYPDTVFVFNSLLLTSQAWLTPEIHELNFAMSKLCREYDNLRFFNSHDRALTLLDEGGKVIDPMGNGIHITMEAKRRIAWALVDYLFGTKRRSSFARPDGPSRLGKSRFPVHQSRQ